MLQVSAAVLAQIVARPETFVAAYQGLGGSTGPAAYVASQLGSPFAGLPDAGSIPAFAASVAFNVAPAGTTTLDPLTATLNELLTAETLDALHFCKLNALLALIGSPGLSPSGQPTDGAANASLHFLVWLDTVPLNTGAHTQLVITNVLADAYLLLDPMYAFALRIPFIGSGPQANLSIAVNVATMLQSPIARDNFAVLDPDGTSAVPAIPQVMVSGALGPQYLNGSASDGCLVWDRRIAQIIDNMG
jgi:hypothetical protein